MAFVHQGSCVFNAEKTVEACEHMNGNVTWNICNHAFKEVSEWQPNIIFLKLLIFQCFSAIHSHPNSRRSRAQASDAIKLLEFKELNVLANFMTRNCSCGWKAQFCVWSQTSRRHDGFLKASPMVCFSTTLPRLISFLSIISESYLDPAVSSN